MYATIRKAIVLVPALALGTAALAQGADDAAVAGKNQLGVLEYCQAEGHIDGAAVEIQARLLAAMPEAADPAAADAAYEMGKAGQISGLGIDQSLADAAAAQGTDAAALCREMAALVEQAGAN